jgi:hypothetical protein
MTAPIFTQQEADRLFAIRKIAVHDAWTERRRNRENSERSVVLAGETDEANPVPLSVVFHRDAGIGSTNICLEARLPGRPWEGVCRYDIHDLPHRNTLAWMHPPDMIESGMPHRHRYSERAEREIGVWHARAELLDADRCSTPEKLLGAFLVDLNFHFTDTQTHQALFDWVNA